ncbi:SH3 domain-containing protein [Lactiplantibacillus daoliensis]|uniref:SH3 domain-containing protein n=1 Tax=Lactiplantibacillus daoliensis TaxID=2559916 RepID=A0ABW1UHH6_9LACO|nr:SH3 domain-containing protein [Lactiplantibacillus daoliensis]
MNFKSGNKLEIDQSERFKLYKSGKLWLVAGLTFFSFLGGTIISNSTVHADVTPQVVAAKSNSQGTGTVGNNANDTYSNPTTSDVNNNSKNNALGANNTPNSNTSSVNDQNSKNNTSGSNTPDVNNQTGENNTPNSNTPNVNNQNSGNNTPNSNVANNSDNSPVNTVDNQKDTSADKVVPAPATPAPKRAMLARSANVTDTWSIGDTSRPRVDAVDVANYQAGMTQSDYNTLKSVGVKTVIVKATEGTNYTNPDAVSEAKKANTAGLNVDFYHYAHFSSTSQAKAEATNLVSFLTTNGVSQKVLLFADMEDPDTYNVNAQANLNAFWTALNAAGYTNHGVYTSTSYEYRDAVTRTVSPSHVWRAQWPYSPSKTDLWNTTDGAWQFASTAKLPSGSTYTGPIDVTIDYSGFIEQSAGTATFSNGSSTAVTGNTNNTNVAETGTYKFTGTTAIKSADSDSASTVGTYYKGDSVRYNAKISKDGQTWLRYLAASGAQRYVKIAGATVSAPANNNNENVNSESGVYRFTGTTAIKSADDDSASTVGTYYKGSTVRYNAKITKNGQTWLRYLAASGAQRYVKIAGTTASSSSSNNAGYYTFNTNTNIRTGASLNASIVGEYYTGESVHYIGTVSADGYTWVKYLAASGNYRYVAEIN